MQITKAQIRTRLNELQKNSQHAPGKTSVLFEDKDFQEAFTRALMRNGQSSMAVWEELNKAGYQVSYRQVAKYVAWLLGNYPGGRGRPPQYLQVNRSKVDKKMQKEKISR